MILYHNAFGSLAGIILIGVQCVTGLYLLFLAASLDLAWICSPPPPPRKKQRNIISTPETDSSPYISGIRGITLVSVSHWSKPMNSTKSTCYYGGHLGFSIKMTPKPNLNTRIIWVLGLNITRQDETRLIELIIVCIVNLFMYAVV